MEVIPSNMPYDEAWERSFELAEQMYLDEPRRVDELCYDRCLHADDDYERIIEILAEEIFENYERELLVDPDRREVYDG